MDGVKRTEAEGIAAMERGPALTEGVPAGARPSQFDGYIYIYIYMYMYLIFYHTCIQVLGLFS